MISVQVSTVAQSHPSRPLHSWSAAEYAAILLVPETFTPALLVKKAKFLRSAKGGGREDVRAPLELDERSIPRVIAVSCLRPFRELVTLLFCDICRC